MVATTLSMLTASVSFGIAATDDVTEDRKASTGGAGGAGGTTGAGGAGGIGASGGVLLPPPPPQALNSSAAQIKLSFFMVLS